MSLNFPKPLGYHADGSEPAKYLADISKKEIAGQLRWLNRIAASATVDDKTKQAASTLKACLESIYDTKS